MGTEENRVIIIDNRDRKKVIEGKKLVVVDDSIVRGTTTPRVIGLLRRAGASEIHMRICAPPIRYPCFLGVDMATRRELIAAQKSIPEIAITCTLLLPNLLP